MPIGQLTEAVGAGPGAYKIETVTASLANGDTHDFNGNVQHAVAQSAAGNGNLAQVTNVAGSTVTVSLSAIADGSAVAAAEDVTLIAVTE